MTGSPEATYIRSIWRIRAEAFHDDGNQIKDHRYGNRCDGDRFYLHEKRADRTDLYCHCLGIPSVIFLSSGKNGEPRGGRRRKYLINQGNIKGKQI